MVKKIAIILALSLLSLNSPQAFAETPTDGSRVPVLTEGEFCYDATAFIGSAYQRGYNMEKAGVIKVLYNEMYSKTLSETVLTYANIMYQMGKNDRINEKEKLSVDSLPTKIFSSCVDDKWWPSLAK